MEKLEKSFYCCDEDGVTDAPIVNKVNEIIDVLNSMEKRGTWVTDNGEIKCSQCGIDAPTSAFSLKQWQPEYCPHCGTKMERKKQ